MKLLVVCQYFAPEPFRIADICAELAKRGHSVEVLTGIPNYPEGRFYPGYGLARRRRETIAGVLVRRVPLVPRGRGDPLALALNFTSFALCASLAALRTGSGGYDAVLVYQLSPVLMALPGIVAARMARAPLALYVVDLWPDSLSAAPRFLGAPLKRAFGWIVDRVYRRSDRIWVVSEGFIPRIRARGQAGRKLRYLPQYPEDLYGPARVPGDDPARREIPAGFNVVYAGNLGFSQGLEVALRALEHLSGYEDIRLILIGEGRARGGLRKAVAARGLESRVLFLGRRPAERVPAYLALAGAALVCLRKDPLFAIAIPAKLQSCLACGVPLIGSVDGDAARIISEAGAGLVGPAGDSAALAQNILELYRASPEERRHYAENGIRYCEKAFNKDRILREMESELLALVEKADESYASRHPRGRHDRHPV